MTSADEADTKEYPCLVRVTDGKELNLSTRVRAFWLANMAIMLRRAPSTLQVDPGELDKFHAAYGSLLKASMSTLRKRDRKREKQRAEEAARRKRRLTEQIVIEGAKRGNGRRKRQRRMKQAIKQEGTRKRVQEREEEKAKAKLSS